MLRIPAKAVVSVLTVPLTLVSAGPYPSESEESQQRLICERWRERAQELREQDHYLAARDAFGHCVAESCPAEQRRNCLAERRRLERQIPRLSVKVQDIDGAALDHARVFVDGRFAAAGAPFEVDPGPHLVRTEDDHHVGRLERVRISPGERLVLPVRLRARRELGDERLRLLRDRLQVLQGEHWPMPEAAWTLAGIGAASLAGALILDAQAGEGLEGMRGCAPKCEEAIVAAVEREIQMSRIAGGLSVLSLAAAAWLALADSPADAFAPRSSGAPRLRLQGGADGMRVILRTSFDETLLFRGLNPVVPLPQRPPTLPVPEEPWCPNGCLQYRTPLEF